MSEKETSRRRRLFQKVVDSVLDNSSSLDAVKGTGLSQHNHFADSLLEKLIRYGVSENDIDKVDLEEKFKSPDRANKPKLSFGILTSNFRSLSGRMSHFFRIQYGVIHIISWKNPNKTLAVLVLYTWLCMWPHLVLAYPLIFVVFGAFIPGYLHRHPMMTPELIKVKKRGLSLWEFLNDSEEYSIIEDIFKDPSPEQLEQIKYLESDGIIQNSHMVQNELSPSSSKISSSDPIQTDSSEDANLDPTKKEKPSTMKKQLNLLLNMRDLQNLTTDLIKSIEQGEKVWFETAGFKNENLSTLILYGIFGAICIILIFGAYIPWRMIFIILGWVLLLLCHPHSKTFLVELQNKPSTKRNKKIIKREIEKHEREDIIVDDPPEVRNVEIFELERKSLLTNEWKFYGYANTIFDTKNQLRMAGKRPVTVDHLLKITPPTYWKFDIGYVNEWRRDLNPQVFVKERGIDSTYLSFEPQVRKGWIYDTDESLDFSYTFRRRRLLRKCYRYSIPPMEPKS